MDLEARWPLPGATELRDRLLAAYADPQRGYHDVRHLEEVLDRLHELGANATPFDARTVRLAAWFHDAVYDGRPGAEDRSARWAEEVLTTSGLPRVEVAEVARLVRLTERHDPRAEDRNGAALCDADLAVLAAAPTRYQDYTAGVRREYACLPERDFRAGRSRVLRALLASPRLFTTDYAVAAWEATARENVNAELQLLESPED
jgi:predicted metal-dependent HD superfamily phosphohydrolase